MRGLPARTSVSIVEGMVVVTRMLELGDEDGGVGGIWARFRLGELVACWVVGRGGMLELELWHEQAWDVEAGGCAVGIDDDVGG